MTSVVTDDDRPATIAITNEKDSAVRVSTLELFFDAPEIARAFLVLTIIWWMYGGYAWLTNNVGASQPLNRVLVLTAMAGFLVMALAVPQAFDRDGLAFGLAYLLVNVIHAALFTHAPDASSAQAIWRIAPLNIGVALLIVVAGLVAPAWNWLLWLGALLLIFVITLSWERNVVQLSYGD